MLWFPSRATPEKAVQYMYVHSGRANNSLSYIEQSEALCKFQRQMKNDSSILPLEGRDRKETRTISTHLTCTDSVWLTSNWSKFLHEARLSFFCCSASGGRYRRDISWGHVIRFGSEFGMKIHLRILSVRQRSQLIYGMCIWLLRTNEIAANKYF